MVNILNLTKDLHDLRVKAEALYNRYKEEGHLHLKSMFDEIMVEINSIKVKIDSLKDKE